MDSVDKMADVRSEVAVQWLLFTQTMGAARTAFTMLRDMQQLIGHVERVTEMLDTLDRVQENKKDEKKANFIQDNCIEFKDVTVITPANVMLVEKLSFRLDQVTAAPPSPLMRCHRAR